MIHLACLAQLQLLEPHSQKFSCIINFQKSESGHGTSPVLHCLWKNYKLHSVAYKLYPTYFLSFITLSILLLPYSQLKLRKYRSVSNILDFATTALSTQNVPLPPVPKPKYTHTFLNTQQ